MFDMKLLLQLSVHAGMLVLLGVLLVRYFLTPFASARTGAWPLLTRDSKPHNRLRPAPSWKESLLPVVLLFLASRAMFILLGGIVLEMADTASFPQYIRNLPLYWSRWDARHYLSIAEDWYVNTGDERLKLVFYPLYPLLVRVVNIITGNVHLSAYLTSNACLLMSGVAMYRIVAREWSRKSAMRAVFFLMFAPLSFYFSVPYTESLFVLTTLLAIDFAMSRKWAPALLMGALSALTRSLGLLTAVLIFYEMLIDWRSDELLRPAKQLLRLHYLRHMGLRALLCCTVALGFGAYLLLNWQVSGDPFRFLEYQAANWSQQFGSLWYTIEYSLDNALDFHVPGYRTGVWIPQILYLAAAVAICLLCMRRVRPGYGAYALLYIYMAYAPTWLLSGPRYLTAMAVLYPMLAQLTRRKWAFYLMAALSLIGCAVMTREFLVVGCLL